MGITERRLRERLDVRNAILGSAKELFLNKGFEATTIRNIAEQIEFSPSVIYQYFKDKNEIFYSIHAEAFLVLLRELKTSEQYSHPMEQLVALGNIYIRFALENAELYDLMFLKEAPIAFLTEQEEANWKEGNMAFGYLKSVISKCMEQGFIQGTDVDSFAYLIWSTVHGMVTISIRKRCLHIGISDHETVIQRAYEQFSRLLLES